MEEQKQVIRYKDLSTSLKCAVIGGAFSFIQLILAGLGLCFLIFAALSVVF